MADSDLTLVPAWNSLSVLVLWLKAISFISNVETSWLNYAVVPATFYEIHRAPSPQRGIEISAILQESVTSSLVGCASPRLPKSSHILQSVSMQRRWWFCRWGWDKHIRRRNEADTRLLSLSLEFSKADIAQRAFQAMVLSEGWLEEVGVFGSGDWRPREDNDKNNDGRIVKHKK